MDQRESARLRFRLLGTPSWQSEFARGDLRGKFAVLVAYVAICGRSERDAVVRLLWPGDLDRGRNNLRQHVKRLRETTGHPTFIQDDSIALAPGVECDVFGRPADWPTADLLGRCEFLAGTSLPSLEGWIGQQRHHWSSLIGDALVTRGKGLESANQHAQALSLVSRATEMAPWLEVAWRAKMWLHYLSGDHAAAVHAFAQLNDRIRPSGATPGAETLELWRAIERGGIAPPRPALQFSLLRPPALIGRERQWAAMESAWKLGRSILLRGEAGIGKTRLLLDFVHQHGAAVVVEGRKGDERAPYSTLGSMLRALIDLQGLEPDAYVRREISRLLPELGPLPDVAPADQIALWRAVERLLQQAAESGVQCIAFDDLHFADTASLEALRWLTAGSVRNVLRFAFATRPLESGPRRELIDDWLTDSHRPDWVEVPPLTRRELATLLESLNLVGAPALASADNLYSHAGGHPYLVLETLQELALRPAATPGATLPTPTKALPLLERRVQAVPAGALPLLRLAAVLDDPIDHAAAALDRPLAEVTAMARELEAHGLLLDGRFVHDLMREAVLVRLTPAERRHLHALAAGALATDTRVARARVAAHWEAAERWAEAAAEFRVAGVNARDAGRLPESRELLRSAAACSHNAGDISAEFDVLHDSFLAELELLGPDQAQPLLTRLDTLARIPEQQARVAIAKASVAIHRYHPHANTLALATQAMTQATPFEHLRCDALAIQALAFAQAARSDEAIGANLQALALAEAGGRWRKAREVSSNLTYVYYEASRFGEAITLARKLVEDHDAAGDRSSAAGMESNLAAMLLLTGDPAAALAPASRAQQRHREIEPSASSPLAWMNRATLCSALAYFGRFSEALEVLDGGGPLIADSMANSIRAKARLMLAHVWLILGAEDQAVAALGPGGEDWPASMQVQRCWALARAATIRGASPEAHLQRIGIIQAENWDSPLSRSPWLEWSRQGDANDIVPQLRRLQALYEQADMAGTARTAALRRIDRLSEIEAPDAIEAAATLARELRPQLAAGLHPSTYLPEAWQIVSVALARAGETTAAFECLAEARHWIEQVALPNVPLAWRDSFIQRNLVNRGVLSTLPAHGRAIKRRT